MTGKTEDLIQKIILNAGSDSYSSLESLFPKMFNYKLFLDQITLEVNLESNNSHLHFLEAFNYLSDKYDFNSLLNFTKGLIIIENRKDFSFGSVSPVIKLYQKLVYKSGLFYEKTGDWEKTMYNLIKSLEQNPNTKIKKFTDWILINSENEYIPFGSASLHSETILGIKINLENRFQRKNESVAREIQEKLDEEKRLKLYFYNVETHEAKVLSDREYRLSLRNLNNNELLIFILNDKKKPIYFYSNELITMIKIKPNEKELLSKLIVKLDSYKTKQSKKLNKYLSKIMEK